MTSTQEAGMVRRISSMRRTKLPNNQAYETKIYKTVERMLANIANNISRKASLPFDELRAQADLLFVLALRRYDEERPVKFSTFLYTVVRNGLIDYGYQLKKHEDYSTRVFAVIDDDGKEQDPIDVFCDIRAVKRYEMIDLLMSLTADETALADLVLHGFAASMEHLRTIAMERLGYDLAQFDDAVDGLKTLMGGMG